MLYLRYIIRLRYLNTPENQTVMDYLTLLAT